MTVWRKAMRVAVVVTQMFRRWQWLNLSRIHYHGRRRWSFCRNSCSVFDRATVSLKCQTWQAYWRSGPARIKLPKQTVRTHQNTHFETPKWNFLLGRGHRHILSAPLSLRLWRSTWPPPKSKPESWIRRGVTYDLANIFRTLNFQSWRQWVYVIIKCIVFHWFCCDIPGLLFPKLWNMRRQWD